MGFFWLILGISILLLIPAAGMLTHGLRMWRRNHWGSFEDGEGLVIIGGLLCVPVLVLWIVLVATAIDRHYSETRCEQKAEFSGKPYVWLDYHYFGYECLLRTPSGNITETPVLPLEDVTPHD
jgi:hypothetical protein